MGIWDNRYMGIQAARQQAKMELDFGEVAFLAALHIEKVRPFNVYCDVPNFLPIKPIKRGWYGRIKNVSEKA